MNRRGFLFGAAATLVAAPAIVRVASIMPVKALPLAEAPLEPVMFYQARLFYQCKGSDMHFLFSEVDPGSNWAQHAGWDAQVPYRLFDVVRAS